MMAHRCGDCGLQYKHSQSLKRHRSSFHGSPAAAPALGNTSKASAPHYECSVCRYSCPQKKEFFNHLQTSHDVNISIETRTFESAAEFYQWKLEYEGDDENRFITSYGNGKVESLSPEKYLYFVCHRSGHWQPGGKGLRHLKTQGSKKINGYCPAQMKISLDADGKVKVLLTRTHWGHLGDELAHLFLTQDEKVSIAAKIAAKVPYTDILNDIRDDARKHDALKRRHLTTRKDLHNIEASFNLSSEAVRHKSDAVSVDAWVSSVRESSDENCILFYKTQGETSEEFPFLFANDFLLCIMNDLQVSLLQQYGNDAVCIDGTHGLNPYDFQLITLIVIDDMRQGFPCAFFFSNRTDKDALKVFYQKIKERVSEFQPPKIFMSDMEESFFNAWVEVFSPPSQRLWCTWHVERAWRKNLAKIKSADKKKEVYKTIKSLMEETDAEAFKRALIAASTKMSNDPQTKNFGKYFDSHYACNPEPWAFCFRVHAGLNTNMHLENLHRCLKHNYLLGKKVKRLDKAVFALMQFLRDKAFDRIIYLHKGKVTKKLQHLRQRHKTSLEISVDKVIPDGTAWKVLSSRGQEMYTINLKNDQCDCQLFCTDCSTCIHKYACSCLDSAIKFNMCKHIHLLCSSQKEMQRSSKSKTPSEVVAERGENELPLVVASSEDTSRAKEKQNLVHEICKGEASRSNDVLPQKGKLINILTALTEEVKHKLGTAEMDALEKLLLPVQPTLQAVRESQVRVKMPFKEVDSSNKRNMDLQPRFFSTKKKKRKVHLLQKPLPEEKVAIICNLIHSTDMEENNENIK